jgi:hypothetical protein
MKQHWIGGTRAAVALIAGLLVGCAVAQEAKPKIIHDAEYYIPYALHGEKWACGVTLGVT